MRIVVKFTLTKSFSLEDYMYGKGEVNESLKCLFYHHRMKKQQSDKNKCLEMNI